MSASLAPECNEIKERYDTCFLKWYSEKYLRGAEKDNKECERLFKQYQTCLGVALKQRGIDKLLEEAREDNKENDARLTQPKTGYITARWDLVTRLYELAIFAWEYQVAIRAAKGAIALTALFFIVIFPVYLLAKKETHLVCVARHRDPNCWLTALSSIQGNLESPCQPENSYDAEVHSKHKRKGTTSTLVMVEHDGLMRVFWPTDIRVSERPGVVVGWRNSTLDVFVVAILDDVDPRNVEIHLRSNTFFRSGPHSSSRIYELCGHSSMHVLGLSNATSHALVDPSWVCATTSASREPRITCAKASSVQLILYDRPRPKGMQYISLNPISLALGDKWYASDDGKGDGSEGEEERRERQHQEAKLRLVNKLKQHSIFIRSASARDKALEKVVHQVNWSWELEQTLQKNVGKLGPRPKRGLSVSERVVESTTAMRNYILMQLWNAFVIYIFPFIRKGFVMLLFLHRAMAEMLLLVLEFRIKPGYAALKDVSATAQQIEIRLLQFCYWPMQYITLRQRKMDWASVNTSHPDYIRFYNSLWLVANDVIIGIAIGSYIIENADWVSAKVNDLLRVYTVDALQSSISWLMGWPAGLKLNGELASFLGALFLWHLLIDYLGGIRFELRDAHDNRSLNLNVNEPPTSVIYLKSVPLSFKAMFNQYFQMAERIRKHYLSPRVFLCLLTGQFVPPINRRNLYSLQYSMLPARRATMWEMWRALNAQMPQKKPFQLPNIPPLTNGGGRRGGVNGRIKPN
ncbi:hypothetical protein MY1884_000095 [Beauveria asiatica]